MTTEVVTDTAPSGEPKAVLKVSDFEAPEPETVEVPDEEVGESEPGEEGGETGENGTGEPEEEEQPEQEKPTKPIQKRFDKMAAKVRQAEEREQEKAREAEYWKGVAEGRGKPEGEPDPDPVKTKLERPNPAEFEYGEADPAYHEALTDWKLDTRLAKERQETEKKQQEAKAQEAARQIEATYAENVAKAKEELPDYDEVVTESVKRGEWPCPAPVAQLIKSLPAGPKVAYHLATNLDDAVELAGMPPAMQLVAFGALAAHYSESSEKQPVKSTSAPPPPQNRTRGSGGQFETGDRSLYKKMLREFR